MSARTASLFLCAALAALAGPALAGDGDKPPAPAPPATQAQAAPAPERPVRVRASHRVEVLAPGEKVETVIGRMRPGALPQGAPDARPMERMPVRGPDGMMPHGPERGPGDGKRGPPGMGQHPPGSGPPQGMGPPSGHR